MTRYYRVLLLAAVLGLVVSTVAGSRSRSSVDDQRTSTLRRGIIPNWLHHHQEQAPTDYQSRSATSKQDFIWQRIQATKYTGPLPTAVIADKRNLTIPDFLRPTFTHVSDEIPEGRKKLTHEYGVVGKVQMEIFGNSPFTGLFEQPGASVGFARLSLAKPDDQVFTAANLALKFFMNAKPSLNFHTFQTVEGIFRTDQNFFDQTPTNIVPDPQSPALVFVFKHFNETVAQLGDGTDGPTRPESDVRLGLWEQAAMKETGEIVSNVVAPYQIVFQPNPVLRASQAKLTGDFRTMLMAIPQGTVLYDVVLHRHNGIPGIFVGRLVLRSAFVASQYGDETLFFQHTSKRWAA